MTYHTNNPQTSRQTSPQSPEKRSQAQSPPYPTGRPRARWYTKLGPYPSNWKESQTAIIRKSAKDDYTNPRAYRPIALLRTLGKLLEKVINNQLMHWAFMTNSIHPGHVGGRPGKCINDSLVALTLWIKHKWREGKIVMGIFLDFKSAYPSVNRERLIHILIQKLCPPYLCYVINSFLSDRTTSLKIDRVVSQVFVIPNSLSQGSPLLVTLYLLYNSSLVLLISPSLNEDEISIAYRDDVTHLLATESVQQSQKRTKEVMTSVINPHTKKEVKWLAITLTLTLSPDPHLQIIKTKANSTIHQLKQIIQPTFGLCQKEARVLIAAVLTTRILHRSVVWYTNKNKKSIQKQLTKELFQAILLSTGMMRQTPSPFLKVYGEIKDLTKQHIELTHNYLHTPLTAPIENAYKMLIWRELNSSQQTHPSPLNNLLEKDTFPRQHFTRAKT
ncbi:hypothetical protein O181_072494 [Austropuccinia psidii MF-1]|uniref:Reverse transcriptase domain-containing protein n=1 Tax=Austropuccinia psidii MF-1 TaxID=1389203 RepID=A0A9Q3IBJ6_9BASI|nr:hypothetical protein [Austropuccinia psidii MF-1]